MARPTLAAAEALGERLLGVATELFLAQGYGATSIEAVVQACQMSKRTFYSRYADKAALFEAVVRRIVDGLRPPGGQPLVVGNTPREQLTHLATLILHGGLAPQGLALHRLITGEALRFPDLARIVHDAGGQEEVAHLVAGILQQAGVPGKDPLLAFAGGQFLALVLTGPRQRALGLGEPLTPAQQQEWARQCVDLFLHGCLQQRPRLT